MIHISARGMVKLQLWCQHLPSNFLQVQQRAHREVSFHVGRGGSRGGRAGIWEEKNIHLTRDVPVGKGIAYSFLSESEMGGAVEYFCCSVGYQVAQNITAVSMFRGDHETTMTGKPSGRRCSATKARILV